MPDRYDCVAEFGRTMWGTRWRGYDRDSEVSVEVLQLDKRYAETDGVRDLVRYARRLRHDQFVSIADVDWNENFIVSERRETTLRERIEKAPISQNDARRFLIRMLGLIKYFQDTNPEFVHGDICPENILFSSPKASIIDAKLLYSLGPTLNGTTLLTGRLKYYAPEMLNSDIGPITSRVDVYSLGFVTLEALAGNEFDKFFLAYGTNERMRWSQFHGSTRDYLQNLDEYVPNLASDLKNALDGMLVKSLASRIYDPTEIIEELELGLANSTETSETEQSEDEDESMEKIAVFDDANDNFVDESNKDSTLSLLNVRNFLKTLAFRPYVLWPVISILICAFISMIANLDALKSKKNVFWGMTSSHMWIPNPTDLNNEIYIVEKKKGENGESIEVKTPLAHGELGWQASNGKKKTYEFVSHGISQTWIAQFEYSRIDEDKKSSSTSTPRSLVVRRFADENDVKGEPLTTVDGQAFENADSLNGTTQFWPVIYGGKDGDSATFYVNGKKEERGLDKDGRVKASIDVLSNRKYEIVAWIPDKLQFQAKSNIEINNIEHKEIFNDTPLESEQDQAEKLQREAIFDLIMGFDVELWRKYDASGRDEVLKAIGDSYNVSFRDMRIELLNLAKSKTLDSLDRVVFELFNDERLTVERGEYGGKLLNPWDKLDQFLKERFENEEQIDPRPALWRAVVDAQRKTRDFLLKTPSLPADMPLVRKMEERESDVGENMKKIVNNYFSELISNDSEHTGSSAVGNHRVKGFYAAQRSLEELNNKALFYGSEADRKAFVNKCRYYEGVVALGAAELIDAVKDQTRFFDNGKDKFPTSPTSDEKEFPSSAYVDYRKQLVEIAWEDNLKKYETQDQDERFVKLAAELRYYLAHSGTPTLLEELQDVEANYQDVNRYYVAVAEFFVAKKDYAKADECLAKTTTIDEKKYRDLARRKARALLKIAVGAHEQTDMSKTSDVYRYSEAVQKLNDIMFPDANKSYSNSESIQPDRYAYEISWEEIAQRFRYFDDNLITFPREFSMSLMTLSTDNTFDESARKKFADMAEKLTWYPTCPIQCLLFCNPAVNRNQTRQR